MNVGSESHPKTMTKQQRVLVSFFGGCGVGRGRKGKQDWGSSGLKASWEGKLGIVSKEPTCSLFLLCSGKQDVVCSLCK